MTEDDHAMNRSARLGRCWYVWDALLTAVILAVGGLLNCFGIIDYVGGTRNEDYAFFGVILVILGLGPLALICLIMLIARMRTIWPEHVSSRRKLHALQILV